MLFHWRVDFIDQGHVRTKYIYATMYDIGNKCMNECIYDYMIISITKADERHV